MADEVSITPADTALATPPAADIPATPPAAQTDTPPAADPPDQPDTTTPADGGSEGAEEGYADFTMPEGVDVDAEALAAFTPLFKEMGLSQDQAQKLIDVEISRVEGRVSKEADDAASARLEKSLQWADDSKNDKEIGGEKFDENVGIAVRAVEKFGTPAFQELLNDGEFGIGNHPEMIRFLANVGRLTQEDVPGGGSPTQQPKSRSEILYPTK